MTSHCVHAVSLGVVGLGVSDKNGIENASAVELIKLSVMATVLPLSKNAQVASISTLIIGRPSFYS